LPLDVAAELRSRSYLRDAADAITLPRYRRRPRHPPQADASEVTDADTGSESAMRALLA
jgi:fructose-1,6-bisphosphatase/inositol monophosphatase family enzyme